MSTRIHNGIQLLAGSFHDLNAKIMDIKALMDATYREALTNRERILGENRWVTQTASMLSHQPSGMLLRDHNFSVIVFPVVLEGNVEVYLGMYYGSKAMAKLLLDQPWVEEYAYWDNTDRPETISASQWDMRKHIWNSILLPDGYGIPDQWGWRIEVLNAEVVLYQEYHKVLSRRKAAHKSRVKA